jgi:ABC-type transport system involved in multi-copper enzyme maturation permease subunit
MRSLIRTEWLKIKNYPAFWWVMGITALTYPGINYMFLKIYEDMISRPGASAQIAKALLGNPFAFPEGWRTIAYFSSLFVFIPAIVIIMLITNEYTFKTNRQNIIDGWSRRQFMTAKMIDVIILSVIVTALFAVVALVIGISNTKNTNANIWQLSYYIGLFALQTFSQLSIAFLVGLLVRKSFIALAIFAFYFVIVEPIGSKLIEIKLKSELHRYLPLEVSHRLLPKPAFIGRLDEATYKASIEAVKYHIGYTLILLVITWAICFWINHKRDL